MKEVYGRPESKEIPRGSTPSSSVRPMINPKSQSVLDMLTTENSHDVIKIDDCLKALHAIRSKRNKSQNTNYLETELEKFASFPRNITKIQTPQDLIKE